MNLLGLLKTRLAVAVLAAVVAETVWADSSSNAAAESESSSKAAQQQALVNAPSNTYNNPDTVRYRGGYAVYMPPSMSAPALTTTLTDTCMGSWSAGVSIPGGGATFGKTQIDDDCVARLHARQLAAMNAEGLAMEVLCSRQVILDADARMTTPRCAANIKKQEAKSVQTDQVAASAGPTACYRDPIVARRMGTSVCP
jgi:hypothetical protein